MNCSCRLFCTCGDLAPLRECLFFRPDRLTLKSQDDHPSFDPETDLQICTETFVSGRSVDKISHVPSGRYVIIPMLARPGTHGKFVLTVGSASKFKLTQCVDRETPSKSQNVGGGGWPNGSTGRRTPLYASASSAMAGRHKRGAAIQHMQRLVAALRQQLGSLNMEKDRLAEALALLE